MGIKIALRIWLSSIKNWTPLDYFAFILVLPLFLTGFVFLWWLPQKLGLGPGWARR